MNWITQKLQSIAGMRYVCEATREDVQKQLRRGHSAAGTAVAKNKASSYVRMANYALDETKNVQC